MSSLLCCDKSNEDEWNAIIQGGDLFKIIKLETTSKEAKAFVMGFGLTASDIKVISCNGRTEVDVTLYGRMFAFQLVKTEDRKKTGLLLATRDPSVCDFLYFDYYNGLTGLIHYLKKLLNHPHMFRMRYDHNPVPMNAESVVRSSGLTASDIEVKFGENRGTEVAIKLEEKKFVFKMTKAELKSQEGTIMSTMDPLICNFLYSDNNFWTALSGLTRFLMDRLNIPRLYGIRFDDPNRDICDLSNLPDAFKATRMNIGKPTVTKEELDFLNFKFDRFDVLCFHTVPPEDYKKFPFRHQNVCVNIDLPLSWVHLADMAFKDLDLWWSNLSGSELNKFIKHWLASDKQTPMESIYIHDFKGVEDLFEDLPVYPWDPNSRSKNFNYCDRIAINCAKGFDLLRDDGTLATIGYGSLYCIFLVWKRRFPDTSQLSKHMTICNPTEMGIFF
ncbi:hypothetical protein GCK72_004490 [Caenorhabditis remanei]|uniref:Sdz-33 F-box domain-containing protein n=1 Tax=Caenorhabditis remanei TaxID=31234 RepID=A0A6A5HC91_CAERE|nr:hypothetical protein GCK72_004490 [Caenorhabditis remanei]KAF1764541.1 hypothetical protein GCK72_004490 [Caenorhabditis remanei]